jgi:hypothetical protein
MALERNLGVRLRVKVTLLAEAGVTLGCQVESHNDVTEVAYETFTVCDSVDPNRGGQYD